MKFRKRIFYACLISLLIHLGFVLWSFFVKVINYPSQADKPRRLIQVKLIHEENQGEEVSQGKVKNDLDLKPQQPATQEALPVVSSQEQSVVNPDQKISDESLSKPKETVSKEESLKLMQVEKNDKDMHEKVRRATRKRLVEVGDLAEKDFMAGAPVVVAGEDITKNYLEKGFAGFQSRQLTPAAAAQKSDEFQMMKNYSSGIKKRSKLTDFGNALVYELTSYEDPQDKQKYFKISIKVKDLAANLPVLPKEIIFVIDSSQSIGDARFKEFIEGVQYSLKNLNKQDYFNIIVFKDSTVVFKPSPVIGNDQNVKEAVSFVEKISAGSKTDIYEAMKQSIYLETSFSPSYRFLLSDGFSTKGVTDSRQVINEISKINKGKVCIFAFGGGVSVSRYLLDFISYKNRGWARYVSRENLIGKGISQMYESIKDPILLNLRNYSNGLNDKEIFPKILPDFFKGSEFVLYGKYADENRFVIQLLGDIIGETKEFVIEGTLEDASDGGKEIAHEWAFHKVYHLIGLLKHDGDNAALLKEIDDLSHKFDIVTPYSKNFRK